MPDKYMEVRKNTLIQNNARIIIAYGILGRMKDSYNSFIPNKNNPEATELDEPAAYDEIKTEIVKSLDALKAVLEKSEKLQEYYDEQLKCSSEVFRF